jgi:putative tricarboxylic transport membrane protein
MTDLLQALISGFFQVFAWHSFSLMLLGIAIGIIVSLFPANGGPTTLALMLPFTFSMSAVEAFSFLLGMASVSATAGDITSVLFGVPGEATSAALIVDGHPMARKGEAGRALGAVFTSSPVGAIFGAIALVLAIPIARPLVLSFGSPEMFMLGVLAMNFIASLSGESRLKGLIAGGLGFFLATVGMDQISGIQRYTFGQLFLWDGLGLVPIAVGLFAIPEVIELGVGGGSIAQASIGEIGGAQVLQGVKDTFHHFWLVLRCSAIGVYIGLIPGLGGTVAQWASYAHAVQSSPHRERFGRGAIEGVLGPVAATNSILGSTLVPTVAFGVPTSLTTAILLGAFLIHGIVPGPEMLLPEPQGRLSLTLSFVWIIVVSHLIAVAVCFLFVKQLARLTTIRGTLLMPFILLMVFLGAYAQKNAFGDVAIVLLFGALGWVMVKLEWQRPPLILGLVLGPIMENRLFLSTDNYGAAWLWRPGVLILFACTLIGLFYPLWKKRRKARAAPPVAQTAGTPGAARSIDTGNAAFTGFLIVLFAVALWESRDFGYRAGLFPWVVGFPVLATAIALLVLILTGRHAKVGASPAFASGEPEADGMSAAPAGEVVRRTVATSAWILGFFVAIWLLGFSVGFALMAFLYMKVGGREKWSTSLIVTGCGVAVFYGLFVEALNIPFPRGLLFSMFS